MNSNVHSVHAGNARVAVIRGHTAYLSLGSNMGDSRSFLEKAAKSLEHPGEIQINRLSSLYRTEPVDMHSDSWFMNCVAQVTTTLAPLELLDRLEEIEFSMGRKNKGRREDRMLDIDILLYDDMIVSFPRLTIPHPEMANRRFVLEPLMEIAPDVVHPLLRKTSRQLCAMLEGQTVLREPGE